MTCKLSILIPSLHSRTEMYFALIKELEKQKTSEVEIISCIDNGELSIGAKRNELMRCAVGKYVCYIDDDDSIGANYIEKLFEGIKEDVDCCSLIGVITWDGCNPELFEHSVKYDKYKTNATGSQIIYERYPNHLNCIKTSIAKQFKFPEINFGEDTDWATQVKNSGLIKTEYKINEVIYHYHYTTTK